MSAYTSVAQLDNPLPLMQDGGDGSPYRKGATRPRGTTVPYEVGTPAGEASSPATTYGDNNEKLPKALQLALQYLLTLFVNEGQRARRDEVKRCRLAREFWKGLQYQYWTADGAWHLPWDTRNATTAGDEPRYAYVTNYYQAFGLSIMAVLSQDIPAVRLWPQNPDDPADQATAEDGTAVVEVIERNNEPTEMLLDEAFYLWTDGKVGGYVRYVVDGQRWGYQDEEDLESRPVKLGEDAYVCPDCQGETPADQFMGVCAECGAELDEDNLRPAEIVQAPYSRQTVRTPNGAEIIDIYGGLELKTPPWARKQHQFPYIVLDLLAHRARLRASYPWTSDRIGGAAIMPEDANASYERTAALNLVSGGATEEPSAVAGDLTQNLLTYRQAWLRSWAFEMLEDKSVRDQLYAAFPDGCYMAFAGDVYCCSRNESMDDHWRVMHALPGDGQDRPAIGTSYVSVQERFNTLANLTIETIEHGIPATFAMPGAVDFEAIRESYVEPGAIYPGVPPVGQPMRDAFFEATPARLAPEVATVMDDLRGQTGQFLTGAFPALFGGEMQGNDTAHGYEMARDQAMGRIGLVWRRMKQFHADLMMLGVRVFAVNRPPEVQFPVFGPSGQSKSRWIRTANLKGNLYAYPESDAQYPTLWSQQRAVLLQLMQSQDPMIQQVLGHPENAALIKRLIGLENFALPDEDSRNKQMQEIDQLLQDGAEGLGPIEGQPTMGPTGQVVQGPPHSTVPVDEVLDNHDVEFETIQAWANGEAGRQAKIENPMGYMNVRAHALEHQQAKLEQQMQQQAQTASVAATGMAAAGAGPKPAAVQ
jgi:hypothetical protein